MKNIEILETVKPAEKKLVALEMSKEMWKKLRLEAVNKDISFSAVVRFIVAKYFRENDAKLIDNESDEGVTNE